MIQWTLTLVGRSEVFCSEKKKRDGWGNGEFFFFLDCITNHLKHSSPKRYLAFFQIIVCCGWGSSSQSVSCPPLGAVLGGHIQDAVCLKTLLFQASSRLCSVVQTPSQLDSKMGRENFSNSWNQIRGSRTPSPREVRNPCTHRVGRGFGWLHGRLPQRCQPEPGSVLICMWITAEAWLWFA